MSKDNGGPAFPHHFTQDSIGDCAGMTLRDWFAGLAMQSMLPDMYDYEEERHVHAARSRLMAADAYATADAMLAERSK